MWRSRPRVDGSVISSRSRSARTVVERLEDVGVVGLDGGGEAQVATSVYSCAQ